MEIVQKVEKNRNRRLAIEKKISTRKQYAQKSSDKIVQNGRS